MWFDVEEERYTTGQADWCRCNTLWFDVEEERYTTSEFDFFHNFELWFDVEEERYTTEIILIGEQHSCGLM